jgi:prolyl-tRNA synthetase
MTKKETGLKLSVKKDEDFHRWYTEVITKSEMIDYYDVSGCYILRPWSYEIWEVIKNFIDIEIKASGVKPCYFPLFVTEEALKKEENHINDFSPEVAWVTHSGDSKLEKPLAIRPTSETIMYPSFSKWVRSHRDLPMRLNQWTNVVRWEFKNPTPFIRTREFLWQEGHSVYSNKEDADEEVYEILDLYESVYQDILAVPVIKGRKSLKEKFAGSLMTTTVEAFIPNTGRGIQGATSHSLGQNFAKMFDITFESSSGSKETAWQNSWGLTTRTIGVAIMVHGDDKGLVLPPKVAPLQVIIICIYKTKDSEETKQEIIETSSRLVELLKNNNIRASVDLRTDKTPGFKYSEWELKGVPLRLEIGPRDILNKQCIVVRRDTGEKTTLGLDYMTFMSGIFTKLKDIHKDMLEKATIERDSKISVAYNMKEFKEALDKGHMVKTAWCQSIDSEEFIKKETSPVNTDESDENPRGSAKTLCIPLEQDSIPKGTKCFTGSNKDADVWCLWGYSY